MDENQTPARDPFIEEVRALKAEASARFGHDLAKIGAHLREIERSMAKPPLPPPSSASTKVA